MFTMRRKLLVGIDIGTHSIKVVRLKQKGKGYQLLNFGIMPLRPEAIVDGNIAEPEVIVESIRNLMRMEKIRAKEVATAISGQSVIVKRIRVPQMTEKELAEAIRGKRSNIFLLKYLMSISIFKSCDSARGRRACGQSDGRAPGSGKESQNS